MCRGGGGGGWHLLVCEEGGLEGGFEEATPAVCQDGPEPLWGCQGPVHPQEAEGEVAGDGAQPSHWRAGDRRGCCPEGCWKDAERGVAAAPRGPGRAVSAGRNGQPRCGPHSWGDRQCACPQDLGGPGLREPLAGVVDGVMEERKGAMLMGVTGTSTAFAHDLPGPLITRIFPMCRHTGLSSSNFSWHVRLQCTQSMN